MGADEGERIADAPQVHFTLPRVVALEIRRIPYTPPTPRNFPSSLPSSEDAVEFLVTTEAPIPTRALGPALYVGEAAVTEVSEAGTNTYRFVALRRADLREDAPIRLGWTGQTPEVAEGGQEATFRFRV